MNELLPIGASGGGGGGEGGRLRDDLAASAPLLMAYARLCAEAVVTPPEIDRHDLSRDALAILFAAREYGGIELKTLNTAFEAYQRWLTVHVDTCDGCLVFRERGKPQSPIRYLDAFRELCARGLVLHHLHHDFSLSSRGFELAAQVDEPDVEDVLRLLDRG